MAILVSIAESFGQNYPEVSLSFCLVLVTFQVEDILGTNNREFFSWLPSYSCRQSMEVAGCK